MADRPTIAAVRTQLAAETRANPSMARAASRIDALLVGLAQSTGGRAVLADGRIAVSIAVADLPIIVTGAIAARGVDFTARVTSADIFAGELVRTLNDEEDDGTTPVHRMFDEALQAAYEAGAEGVEECSETEFEEEAARLQHEPHALPAALSSPCRDRLDRHPSAGDLAAPETHQRFLLSRLLGSLHALELLPEINRKVDAIMAQDDDLLAAEGRVEGDLTKLSGLVQTQNETIRTLSAQLAAAPAPVSSDPTVAEVIARLNAAADNADAQLATTAAPAPAGGDTTTASAGADTTVSGSAGDSATAPADAPAADPSSTAS